MSLQDPSGRVASQTTAEKEALLRHLSASRQLEAMLICQGNPDTIRRSILWSRRNGLIDSIFDEGMGGIYEFSVRDSALVRETHYFENLSNPAEEKKSNLARGIESPEWHHSTVVLVALKY